MTDEINRREAIILLATAMGWHRCHPDSEYFFPPNNYKRCASTPDTFHILGLPDPFTSANDDYAVLEHYRNDPAFADAVHHLIILDRDPTVSNTSNYGLNVADVVSDYKIGLWARAALKVIETPDEKGEPLIHDDVRSFDRKPV